MVIGFPIRPFLVLHSRLFLALALANSFVLLIDISTELSAAGTGSWAQSLATVSQQTSGARQSQAQALCI